MSTAAAAAAFLRFEKQYGNFRFVKRYVNPLASCPAAAAAAAAAALHHGVKKYPSSSLYPALFSDYLLETYPFYGKKSLAHASFVAWIESVVDWHRRIVEDRPHLHFVGLVGLLEAVTWVMERKATSSVNQSRLRCSDLAGSTSHLDLVVGCFGM